MSSENVQSRRVEVMAGLTSFFAISYIIIVNPLILADGGIPAELSVFATIFASALGCLLMALWADAPIILTPGMGINAFFTYTVVANMGFRWQEALAISLVSALIFFALAVTRAGRVLADAVPKSLKYAVTAGIGLFLVEIGLEKAELIRADENSILALGDLQNPSAQLALLGLVLSLLFYQRRVKGGFFIAILVVTVIANVFDLVHANTIEIDMTRLGEYGALLFVEDFSAVLTISFWLAVFSMTMILVFESIGLLEGLLPDTEKFRNAFRASSLTAVLSSVLGTSPTVAAAESAAGIVEGGAARTDGTRRRRTVPAHARIHPPARLRSADGCCAGHHHHGCTDDAAARKHPLSGFLRVVPCVPHHRAHPADEQHLDGARVWLCRAPHDESVHGAPP